MFEFRATALAILASSNAQTKVIQLLKLFDEYQQQRVTLDISRKIDSQDLILPGRPVKPELVLLSWFQKKMDTPEGRAGLLHSLALLNLS
jgi:uncharacterized ferritin-like protein (DUF455 family)